MLFGNLFILQIKTNNTGIWLVQPRAGANQDSCFWVCFESHCSIWFTKCKIRCCWHLHSLLGSQKMHFWGGGKYRFLWFVVIVNTLSLLFSFFLGHLDIWKKLPIFKLGSEQQYYFYCVQAVLGAFNVLGRKSYYCWWWWWC